MIDEFDEDFDLDTYERHQLEKHMRVIHVGAKGLPEGQKLYRISDAINWYQDEGHEARLYIEHIPILKRTPKGAWVETWKYNKRYANKTFVLITKEYGKRYAYPALEGAMKSYRARKIWQKHHGELTVARSAIGMDMLKLYQKKLEHAKNGLGPDV